MSYTHGTAENETEHGYVATANRIMPSGRVPMSRHRTRKGQLFVTISAFVVGGAVGLLLGIAAFTIGIMMYLAL